MLGKTGREGRKETLVSKVELNGHTADRGEIQEVKARAGFCCGVLKYSAVYMLYMYI